MNLDPKPNGIEILRPKSSKIWAKLCHQSGLGIRDSLRSMCTYPVPIGWFIQQWWGNLPSIHVTTWQPGSQLPTSMSLSAKEYLSYPERSRELQFYLTTVQKGSLIQNGFSLVSSYRIKQVQAFSSSFFHRSCVELWQRLSRSKQWPLSSTSTPLTVNVTLVQLHPQSHWLAQTLIGSNSGWLQCPAELSLQILVV